MIFFLMPIAATAPWIFPCLHQLDGVGRMVCRYGGGCILLLGQSHDDDRISHNLRQYRNHTSNQKKAAEEEMSDRLEECRIMSIILRNDQFE
jgi:hypothetical protein